ncbi:M81 family metallopeptidase [Paenibacillus thalictri]|uniref:M81 family peptidase n=1 Tax=Paenibacillus thalictri TaxID=2527873 RepID=A0A4Q9DDC4_9BACL|nr:M81 family metallopeptidase [Paenibacillus thalictri]TBL69093.1 M81 family peptidase [Paenibacillus thalictri]
MNIIVGGLIQESNTFSTRISTIEDFKRYYYMTGEEMSRPQKSESELSGFYKAAAEEGVALIPTLYAGAVSAGVIERRSLNQLKLELLEKIGANPACDGVLLALHGAWVAEDSDDADGEILEAVQELIGKHIPIVVTLDSHSNITRKMIDNCAALIGYRTFPHADFAETGYRAAKLLFSIIRGEVKLYTGVKKLPMIVPAENQQTYRGPMAELWQEALEGERKGASVATSLFAVQPWLDVEEMGFAAVVIGTDGAQASAEAERLASIAWDKRKEFDVTLYTVRQIIAHITAESSAGVPFIISDSADSPGAGSPGDSNFVLCRLLEEGADKHLHCLLSIVDGPAARKAAEAGAGAVVKLQVGHTVSPSVGSPIQIEGVVERVGDGKFYFGGGTIAKMEANMGYCAVVKIGTISLLIMEHPTFTGDPAMYRSVGLEPADADLVLVKSANQFRAEYEQISDRIFILDTPGASTANLVSLPFRKVQRPMYPFDDNFM